ncbi:MAG: Sir2 family NAD-dependent protein deacetylase [Dehalococcoidales bacterium]|nr:Sir2 family NAD-dependent protein deacetylase [Dehalococcoidales bacterium]
MDELDRRIERLGKWIYESHHLVVFTGAGISTESGLPDFRGPNGLWTRKDKGLPVTSPGTVKWHEVEPNAGHKAIVEIQNLNRLYFLISQNVDNLHLKSGIRPELLAELHGNLTKIRCTICEFTMDNFEDAGNCPLCGGKMKPSVVDFGQSLPRKDLNLAIQYSRDCDLFVVIGSSLVVTPAADMPRIALETGARLVIINQGDTPLDSVAHLRFGEPIGQVLPPAVKILGDLINSHQ